MPTTTVQVRMDTSVKAELEAMLQEMGLNMTTAMNLFAKAVINSGKIPFEITAKRHLSTELQQDLEDVRQRRNLSQTFTSTADLYKDLGI